MKKDHFKKIVTGLKSVSISFAMLGLVLTAGFASTTFSVAATADELTPANEGICNGLKTNATPGLYGLCVAYCEAQDLDITDKDPPKIKILENYRKRMQAGDPDMPCVNAPCPCWSNAQFSAITSDGLAAVCLKTSSTAQLIDNVPSGTGERYAFADTARNRCAYVDRATTPQTVNFQSVTPTEAQSCLSAVTTTCSYLGL
jgi:hypothetical protein